MSTKYTNLTMFLNERTEAKSLAANFSKHLFLFVYLFANKFHNIQSKFHTATGRTDRRMYRTYVCP